MINGSNDKKITPRDQDFSQWYQDIIEVADLAEHGPVKGTMIIKPYGYAIWENISGALDKKFKEVDVENCYFPLFIPESFLNKEKEHVAGFAPEVAVVTYAGGKKLAEPIIIRPTSETIMYDAFSRWIKTYRDLPLVINQWCNVVRWELRPRLFLRTTEFLWQEGHTAHATFEEADARARQMLDIYKQVAEDYLAMSVFTGIKSEAEKFAGALSTYAVEAIMQDGKALQFSTSHNLGQNFSKVFGLSFSKEDNTSDFVWQTSWGWSTRSIGGLIMTHSDDKGLVLPPKIAPIHVVIVPIWTSEEEKSAVYAKSEELQKNLEESDKIIVKIDKRENLRPGEKYYYWEKRGVPVRLELGPKDLAKSSVVMVRRDSGDKSVVVMKKLLEVIKETLDSIQVALFTKAQAFKEKRTVSVDTWEDFVKEIEKGNFVLAHWSGEREEEDNIKSETKASIRCIPFDQKKEDGKCVYSGKPSNGRVVFARAY